MNKTQLYEMLEIDDPSEVEYYEQVADLIECPTDIPYDLFCDALSQIKAEDAGEIMENYMNEISNALPDDGEDLTLIIENIQSRLMLLAEDLDTADNRRSFADELYKFRKWYTEPFAVSIDGDPASLFDAITSSRIEKLGGPIRRYDLSSRLDYELEELSMNLGAFDKIDMFKEE